MKQLCTQCLQRKEFTYKTKEKGYAFCCVECETSWLAKCDLTWKKKGHSFDVIGNTGLTRWSAYFRMKRVGSFETREQAEEFLKSKSIDDLIDAYPYENMDYGHSL